MHSTAKDDALLYEWMSQRAACVFFGCEVTSLGSNQMRITAGRGIILGRTFEVQQEDFTAQLADPGESWNGRVYIEIDLSNTPQPIAIKTVAAASLPALVQEDINDDGNIYQLELCIYDASDIEASNISDTVQRYGAAIPNPNQLDNSGFRSGQRVNQRGASGTISSAGYFIDRWKLVSGTVQLTDDGLVLNGTIEQILENAIGTSFTASASAGTASYDDSSKTFTIVGAGETISWAKLEKGSVATPWQPKGYGAELAECIRFFRQIRVDWQTYSGAGYNARVPVALVPPMRIAPTASDASRYMFNCTLSGLEFSTSQGGAIALSVPGEGATAYSSLLSLSADL